MEADRFGDGGEKTSAQKEQEAFEAMVGMERQEDYAKRDPVLSRLMDAKTAKDVAAGVRTIEDFENVHAGGTIDRFDFSSFKKVALAGERRFEIGSKKETPLQAQLVAEGIISPDAELDSGGFLIRGDVLVPGYSLKVVPRKFTVRIEEPERLEEHHRFDAKGEKLGTDVIKIPAKEVERDVDRPVVCFGTTDQRQEMHKAFQEFHRALVTSEILQNQVDLTDKTRAALENAVKYYYQEQLYFTNRQTEWFFSAADIAKIPEDPNNKELGKARSDAIRAYYLVGYSETRDKMEEHLNTTYNLEKLLNYVPDADGNIDTSRIDDVLRFAKALDSQRREEQKTKGIPVVGLGIDEMLGDLDLGKISQEDKFKIAARFLISKDLEITTENGHFHYSLPTWLTREQRDPRYQYGVQPQIDEFDKKISEAKTKAEKLSLKKQKEEYLKKAGIRLTSTGTVFRTGEGAVEDEAKEGFRGFLTELGNPYIDDYRDSLYELMDRMSILVKGNDMAVTEAGRYFWTRGMRDELGAEVYAWRKNDKGEWVTDLPSGEQLVKDKNSLPFKDWANLCKKRQKFYKIPGEPVCTDLSKLFHPDLWRLKEAMLDRSHGPYLTIGKFPHLTQSMFSLVRVKHDTGVTDSFGKPVYENRSIREALFGYKKGNLAGDEDEAAIDLGDIKWEQSSMPLDVREFLAGGGVELQFREETINEKGERAERIFNLDLKAVQDNNEGYFWVMNYLAGDDNVNKRPWQFIMKGLERPGDMERPEWYTDKIKFWKIIWHGPAIAWGNWRDRYLAARIKDPEGDREDQVKAAEDDLNKKATDMLENAKQDYFDGLRSMTEYSRWGAEKVQYSGYVNGKPQSGTIDLVQVVEGTDKGRPGMAVMYGFMDEAKIGRAPKYWERFPVSA